MQSARSGDVFCLTVTDRGGLTASDEASVVVLQSSDPPACGVARATAPYLWPPNHKMIEVGIVGVTQRAPATRPATTLVTSS
jgi:hypothetical protein